MTNTLPRFIYGKLDTNEYNFRIWRTNVFEAIRGTVCDWKHDHGHRDGDYQNNREHGPSGEHGYGPSGEHEWERDHQMNWDRSGSWNGGYNGERNGYKHY